MPFMQRQIKGPANWVIIETPNGSEVIEDWLVSKQLLQDIRANSAIYAPDESQAEDDNPLLTELWEQAIDELDIYVECYSDQWISIEVVKGWGARLSAPGYMDQTEWILYNSQQEAEDGLYEDYPEDEEESPDET